MFCVCCVWKSYKKRSLLRINVVIMCLCDCVYLCMCAVYFTLLCYCLPTCTHTHCLSISQWTYSTVSLEPAYLLVSKLSQNYLTLCVCVCVNLSKCHAYSIAGAIVFDLLCVSVCAVGGWLVCLAVEVYCECVRQMAHPLHLHVPPYTIPTILCLSQQNVTFQYREPSWGRWHHRPAKIRWYNQNSHYDYWHFCIKKIQWP